jgi:hypothetical protein
LQEERQERFKRHGGVINNDFNFLLELDDDDDETDFCYAAIGPGMMHIAHNLSRYRSSWCASPPPLKNPFRLLDLADDYGL